MATAGSKVIEKVKVREVAGIFHSRDALVAAVDALLLAGFDRADIDVIVGGSPTREKLGGVHVSIEELPEVPGVPRQPFIGREDLVEVLALAFAFLIFIGAAIAGWIVVASSGSLVWAAIAAAIGAVAAAGIGALIARAFARKHAKELLAQSTARDFVLCVRVRSLEQETKAQEILIGNGAKAVRPNEIQIGNIWKTCRCIRFASTRGSARNLSAACKRMTRGGRRDVTATGRRSAASAPNLRSPDFSHLDR